MAQTKPKAGQFYGVSNNGTDGQFLKTDGTGGMSWDSPITNPTITSIDYPGSATAADPAGGESVIINGTLFASGITCTVGGTSAVTAFNSATQITITTPAKAAGQYAVVVTNPDGGTASQANFIQYSGVPVWSTASGSLGSVQEGATASFQVTATEGSDTIEYAVTTGSLPSGLSLNTNTGAITGTAGSVSASTTTTFSITATDDENQTSSARSFNITVTPDLPSNYFNASIYNGSGASQSITTGFAPDFTWIKSRSNATWHCVADTVRGNLARIFPNDSYQEITNNNGFLSFDSNGFNLDGQGGGGDVNTSGRTYVAWNFKAGGAAVANNDGNQTTQVSANNTLGFSIVSYSTNNDASKTFGHGLDAAPELIITKATNAAVNWAVYNSTIGKTKFLELNTSSSQWSANSGDYWNTTTGVNSTVFGYSYSGTTYDFISYCFTSKPGFSKVGTYTGNGTSQNISTGFKVGFVLIKSATSTQNWMMYDSTRGGNKYLIADSASAEGTSGSNLVNFYTNGFGVSSSNSENQSGQTFIYLAFAADPSTTTPSLANSFSTDLYTGNNTTNVINTVGFKPNLTWVKTRNDNKNHVLVDSVRGVSSVLEADTTAAAATGTDFTSFDTNGFTLAATNAVYMNPSGTNMVSWNWKAGGTPSINTDGSTTSIVSVNDAAGFSIVKFQTDATSVVGHGLSSAPELVIVKRTDSSSSWFVYNTVASGAGRGFLNTTSVFDNSGVPTFNASTVSFQTSDPFNAGVDVIMYCFTSISGYSKVGSYTGTGVAGEAGSLVVTGFQPQFVVVKRIDAANSWVVSSTLLGYNDLYLNSSSAEFASGSLYGAHYASTGFYFNTADQSRNISGGQYIYLAIA